MKINSTNPLTYQQQLFNPSITPYMVKNSFLNQNIDENKEILKSASDSKDDSDSDSDSDSDNNENIDMQVKELDKIVVDFCVPNIMTNVTQYIGYINDIKKPYHVMDMPLDTSNKNKQLQPDVGFVKFQPYTQ